MTTANIITILDDVGDAIIAASRHLDDIDRKIANLSAQGVWNDVPREDWQERNGTRYLYLWFPRRRYGPGWTGPEGKPKIYVGRRPETVKEAQDRINRTRRVLKLRKAQADLKRWLTRQETTITQLHRQLETFPQVDLGPVQFSFHDLDQWSHLWQPQTQR